MNTKGAYYFVCGKHYEKKETTKETRKENNFELF